MVQLTLKLCKFHNEMVVSDRKTSKDYYFNGRRSSETSYGWHAHIDFRWTVWFCTNSKPTTRWVHAISKSMQNTNKGFFATGNYWVRVRGIGFCNSQRVEGLAILSYADSSIPTEKLMFPEQVPPSYDSPYPLGRTLNHHMTECYKEGDDFTCAADLEAHEVHRDHELIDSHPDVRLFLGFKVIEANNSMLFTPPFTKYASEYFYN